MFGNPLDDFNRWDSANEKWLAKFPVCCRCQEPIQQEYAVRIGEDWYCDSCLDELRKEIPLDD